VWRLRVLMLVAEESEDCPRMFIRDPPAAAVRDPPAAVLPTTGTKVPVVQNVLLVQKYHWYKSWL
jgi:hypothetical protein